MRSSSPHDQRASFDGDLSTFGVEVAKATDRWLQAIVIGSAAFVVIAAIAGFVALMAG